MPSTPSVGSLPSRRRRIRSLTVIKQDARWWTLPRIVFTTSAQPHDIDVCYQLGVNVNSYMVKPMDFERWRYALELLMRYWFSVVTLPERRSP
jgi:CheY-like chemotaxis protein